MPYPELMVAPMREDLARLGVKELRTPQDVDDFFQQADGPTLLVVNSVCGCAAGNARPAVAIALQSPNRPAHVATVFAGQDLDATQHARGRFPELPPSSPSFIITNGTEIVEYVPRHRIEGRDANTIAAEVAATFDKLAG